MNEKGTAMLKSIRNSFKVQNILSFFLPFFVWILKEHFSKQNVLQLTKEEENL